MRAWGVAVLVSLLGVLVGVLGLGSVPVLAAGGCPNEAIRKEQGSTRLPDCRAYELVSPVYKGGYGAGKIEAVAGNGEGVAFFSPGQFAG